MLERMIDLARDAMNRAYAPYSGFQVGAVVRGANGGLFAGCHGENAAYPQGCCAEAAAVAAMGLAGENRIAEVLVMGRGEQLVSPCGGCRQRIREFADDSAPVHICGEEGLRKTLTLGELLPLSFGPGHLK